LPTLLRTAWFGLNQAFRRRIHRMGLTPDQFTLLRWVHESRVEQPTQRDLTALMASDANTIASLLKRMEHAGLVQRTTDPHDRRAKRIRLTARGRRAYEQAREVAVALQAEVLAALPADELARFLAQLEAVAHHCRCASERSSNGQD
jgi:DNA-binding MarR family transcriptional regulator